MSDDPVSLGDAAAAALSEIGEDGDVLDGTDYTKVRFVGIRYEMFEKELHIGDEVTFTMRARCVGTGDEADAEGKVSHFVKMKSLGVSLKE